MATWRLGALMRNWASATNNLTDFVANGPEAANLLYERMRVRRQGCPGVMWDLERTCGCCNKEGVRAKDVAERPDHTGWQSYWRNAFTLDAFLKLKSRSSRKARAE